MQFRAMDRARLKEAEINCCYTLHHRFGTVPDDRVLCCCQAVDLLLMEWDDAWHKLLAAENDYEQSGCTKRPEGKLNCCGCTGKHLV